MFGFDSLSASPFATLPFVGEFVPVSGVEATGFVGSVFVTASSSVVAAGVQGTTALGTVTLESNNYLDVTGFGLDGVVGVVSVIGVWSIPGSELNVWTDETPSGNIWTSQVNGSVVWTDGFLLNVISSTGQSYAVSKEVLTSAGVTYLVSDDVLTSSGSIVELTNPWQNVSTASNTWS